MLRLFDVKGNVQQAKHRSIKCDEPGEVRRARSGWRRRRIEGEASLAAAAVKNAVLALRYFRLLSSPAPDKFKYNLDVSMCIQIVRGSFVRFQTLDGLVRRWTGSVTAFLTAAVEASGVRRI